MHYMKEITKHIDKKVPEGIDLTDLNYLQYGDISVVAHELGMSKVYVGGVKNLRHYNVKVLAALLKKGAENRKLLNGTK